MCFSRDIRIKSLRKWYVSITYFEVQGVLFTKTSVLVLRHLLTKFVDSMVYAITIIYTCTYVATYVHVIANTIFCSFVYII